MKKRTKIDEIIEIEELDEEDIFLDLNTETENYIAESIITHNSSPHKKSIATQIYMPNIVKEGIEIVCAIDTSGSINEKDLSDFLSEIFAICRAYQQQLKMTLITCDAKIQDTYEIANGSIDTIKNDVKMKGGGGTSFLPVVKWIEENKRDAKLLLYLTDGFGDKIEKQPYDILWVLSKGGSDELLKDVGQVIKLED